MITLVCVHLKHWGRVLTSDWTSGLFEQLISCTETQAESHKVLLAFFPVKDAIVLFYCHTCRRRSILYWSASIKILLMQWCWLKVAFFPLILHSVAVYKIQRSKKKTPKLSFESDLNATTASSLMCRLSVTAGSHLLDVFADTILAPGWAIPSGSRARRGRFNLQSNWNFSHSDRWSLILSNVSPLRDFGWVTLVRASAAKPARSPWKKPQCVGETGNRLLSWLQIRVCPSPSLSSFHPLDLNCLFKTPPPPKKAKKSNLILLSVTFDMPSNLPGRVFFFRPRLDFSLHLVAPPMLHWRQQLRWKINSAREICKPSLDVIFCLEVTFISPFVMSETEKTDRTQRFIALKGNQIQLFRRRKVCSQRFLLFWQQLKITLDNSTFCACRWNSTVIQVGLRSCC